MSIFKFKQFEICQDKTGMKVGTDGVLLGAWADCFAAKNILDVGSGTGLISIMLAQRNAVASIQAIEIEYDAYLQSVENANASRWKERIEVKHCSFQDFYKQCTSTFDLIVSNPPFFENSQKSDVEKRNLARHTHTLSFDELIYFSAKLLSNNGLLSVIIPYDSQLKFIHLASTSGLFLTRKTLIKPNLLKKPKRVLLEFSKQKEQFIENELTIELSRHVYTPEYIELTRDFYLKME